MFQSVRRVRQSLGQITSTVCLCGWIGETVDHASHESFDIKSRQAGSVSECTPEHFSINEHNWRKCTCMWEQLTEITLEGYIVIAATASFEILVDNSSVAASYCTIINTIYN